MKYILCAGEALFDFISQDSGKSLRDSELFRRRPGGAPMNTAVGLSRLGNRVKFLSKLSSDQFGEALKEFMKKEGVETDLIKLSKGLKTTLAFVAVDESGKPDFTFYREQAADMNLRREELRIDPSEVSVYHFGSISLIEGPSSETFLSLFEELREFSITSFDPNIRKSLIKDRKTYLDKIRGVLERAHIVKLSDEDMSFISGYDDIEKFVRKYRRFDKVTIMTMGEKGSVVHFNGKVRQQKAWAPSEVVDTTGCGDAFIAGFLHVINRDGINWESVKRAQTFGTVSAGIVATRVGAASAMPSLGDIEKYEEGFEWI